MTKAELISIVAKNADLTKAKARNAVNIVLDCIQESLAEKRKVKLMGFGTFTTALQNSTIGVNPQSGESIVIPARIKPKFVPGKKLSEIVNQFQPMSEKRKLERRNFIIDLEIVDKNSDREIGDLADITLEGVMIVSEDPIEEDKMFEFAINLPEEVAEEMSGENRIDIEAVSIRCNQTVHESIYTTGFLIKNLDDANRDKIDYLITEFAV
ncbi:MAG: HU family DNA-binding protein [Proteobacteria bacterium]|nr:HU family DNA-binding protein [Pseudomonadota bacterium]